KSASGEEVNNILNRTIELDSSTDQNFINGIKKSFPISAKGISIKGSEESINLFNSISEKNTILLYA
ncbi:hypothetical protein, partial [Oenococcus oeni]|uniref:hypothetical protein n=1 Tax=Oenococcus oeni TaxID=1247 RepID=UPI0015D66944